MTTLSAVIVHYNTPDLLKRCLGAIFSEPAALPLEVIVVDNASPDSRVRDLPPEFPSAIFRFNPDNLGFARACNQGIGMGEGRYVLLLNPDTMIEKKGLERMVAFMETHTDAGASGPRMVYPDGRLQHSCRRFPTLLALLLRVARLDSLVQTPVRRYLMAEWDHASVREVDWVIGGCLMLRRDAAEQVGLLDEAFFMYYEDIDLCYRLWQAGWKVYYNPEVTVLHDYQRTSARALPNRLSYAHAKSLLRLLRKQRMAWF